VTAPTHLANGQPSSIYNPADITRLGCGIFKRIQTVVQPLGGNMIAWELFPNFNTPGPYHFYVDFGRPGTNEWEPLNQQPVVDSCAFYDTTQWHWDQLIDFYYRVRLVLPSTVDQSGVCQVHVSQPQQANGFLSKRDWLMAREICRKEYLVQRKRANVTNVGWILKRRRWGTSCDRCKEFDTTEVQSTSCPRCWGTGFLGGYFRGVDFRITMEAPWAREFKRDENVSLTNNIQRLGRVVAYPYLDTNDVYVRRDTGERFYVNNLSSIAEISGVPIVLKVEVRLAPVTDIIYNIPIEGTSSSSSSASVDQCGPQAGLKVDNDW
jgi:hypothetical protein